MASNRTFVIAGASLAGAKAAETLRTEGFGGRIVLIGDEAVRPYERPPLSKDYLRGEEGFDSAAVHDEGFYEANAIELRTSTLVTALDTNRSEVALGSGERIRYDQLLLATGTTPRRLSTPGAELPGVHYLRQLVDADALRRVLTASRKVVVIGAGWIGSEVAASARQLGADVAVIDPESVPLTRVLGPEVGAVYRDLHAEHGVEMHLGVTVESIRGTTAVEEVRLTDGTVLPAEAVVIGIGVDEHLATSAPGVYAAGDVANAHHPLYGTRVRLEHWSAALNQGPVAAMNMLGEPTAYDKVPYFFSDQYDLGMEYRGWAPTWDDVVFRGDPATRQFIAFWLLRRRVVAAMNANIWDAGDALEALVRARPPVDSARLIDPSVDLASLAAPSPG
jgi:3-phenylpropionate/trans-cinnamate dioxygenase ferredoxin reductase subunit